MSALLRRKLRRELLAARAQTGAVIAVLAVGVATFVSCTGAYRDLERSYAVTQAKLALADLTVHLTRTTPAEVTKAEALAGVTAVEARLVVSAPLEVPHARLTPDHTGPARMLARIISLPGGQPTLDKVRVLSGALPAADDEVLVEEHFARFHDLHPGDPLELPLPGGEAKPLRVSGVAASAEYLWVSRDRHDVMPTPLEFGVLWMNRAAIAKAAAPAWAAIRSLRALGLAPPGGPAAQELLHGLELAADPHAGNELLLSLTPDADPHQVATLLRKTLPEGAVLEAVPRDELVQLELLRTDLASFRAMALFLPVFFLGVDALIVAALLSRTVDAQRPLIGTLLALGLPRRQVVLHYLSHALATGVPGALLGALVGAPLSAVITRIYVNELRIPFVSVSFHPDLMLIGLAAGVAATLVAGWAPTRRAAAVPPAEAMRPTPPGVSRLVGVLRALGALPLSARFALRDVLRRPGRAVVTALGVSAALVLVLTAGALWDALDVAIDTQFTKAERYDLRADLLSPLPVTDLEARAAKIPGVTKAEVALSVPVQLTPPGSTTPYEALLEGLPPNSQLLRSVTFQGQVVPPPEDGLVLGTEVARKLHVAVGDELKVRPLLGGHPFTLPVAGLCDSALGAIITIRRDRLQRALGLEGQANTVLITAPPDQQLAARRALSDLPQAARVVSHAAVRALIDEMMALGYVVLGVIWLMSAVLAAATLFNTATISVLERRREVATQRALGRPMSAITRTITLEHAVLGLLGALIGIPLAVPVIQHVLSLYQSDLFSLPLVLLPRTLILSSVGVLVVLLLAQWPALRLIARDDLAEAVRARE